MWPGFAATSYSTDGATRGRGAAEIAAFLSWLAERRRVSAWTQNQALQAVLFLYRDVLNIEVGVVHGVIRASRPATLPVVLGRAEVRAILGQLSGSMWLLVALLYGAGLRLLECLALRVNDIDFERRQIIVRHGKGGRDRAVPLPVVTIERLRAHLWLVLLLATALHATGCAESQEFLQCPFGPATAIAHSKTSTSSR